MLVHSDPGFARLEETFAPTAPLRIPVHYTGFVVRDAAPATRPRGEHVVVSAGGGLVGEPLLRAAAEAQPATGMPMRLIAGPLLPEDAWQRLRALAGPGIELRRSVADLGAELRAARASVSQGGYNTALEVIRSGVPGADRALRDAGGGRADAPRAAARAPRRGARAAGGAARERDARRRGAAAARFSPRRASVDLDGARRTGRLLDELLAVPA